MIWPLGSKTFLEPEVEAWHFETWAWLLKHLGGLEELRNSAWVEPTSECFPATEATGHDRVLVLFNQVKEHAGMEAWPCTLQVQPDYMAPLGTFSVVEPGTTTVLTEQKGEGEWEALVTYNPMLADDPLGLVATLAHELSHYRLSYIEEPPPGGPDLEELATDLTVAFMGFGLFGAGASTRMRHGAVQWAGYLSPRGWAFALAVFLVLRDQSAKDAEAHLDYRIHEDLVKAVKYLERHPERLAQVIG